VAAITGYPPRDRLASSLRHGRSVLAGVELRCWPRRQIRPPALACASPVNPGMTDPRTESLVGLILETEHPQHGQQLIAFGLDARFRRMGAQ
jgi:hypothetical protein